MDLDIQNREIRCPMLGHEIKFSYCLKPGNDIPCKRIFDCWWEIFDIETYIKENYSDDIIKEILKPESKIQSIFSIIEAVKKRRKQ